jgi:hypothetical protein
MSEHMPKCVPFLVCAALLLAPSCASTSTAEVDAEQAKTLAQAGTPGASDASKPDAPKGDTPASGDADGKTGEKDGKGEVAKSEDGKPEASDAEKKAKEKEEKEKKEREEAQKNWESKTEKLAKTSGLFTVWSDESTLLLELDETVLGREFLYGAGLGSGAGSSGLYRGAMVTDTDAVLHFERRGEKKVVLVATNSRFMEAGDSLEQRMLDEVTSDSVIKAFDLVAENKDEKRVLVNLGDWLSDDNLQLARGLPGKYSIAKDLSRIEQVANFPKNLEIDHELQMTGSREGGNLTLADARGLAVKVHHSLCALPDDGYKPRAFDQRVGYFFTERKDLFDIYSDDPVHRFINRWRLQKKDPSAEVSDPVQPITYWIENTTPKAWRDAVKKGIEAWEPAFRKAGFSNAIIAKQMPEDADWDPADVRYAVVRWSADEDVGFAIGPSRIDPRTGEIIDADITMQANFLAIYRERFERYVSDLASTTKEEIRAGIAQRFAREMPENFDPRMCKLAGDELVAQAAQAATIASFIRPESFDTDAFLAAMLTEVVSHEVGHTLGLRHNYKSSTWLGLDGLAASGQTAQQGLVGSVMDYVAINIAGPGKPQGEYFPSAVGPYDRWAIEYGYTETGSNEQAVLGSIAGRSAEPGLDYGTDEDWFMGDPFASTWDLGSDPVAFAEEQVRLAEEGFKLLAAKGAEKGEGFHQYSRFFGMMVGHYNRNYRDLERFLWGVEMNRDLVGQEGGRQPLVLVDASTQRRALDILINKGLTWRGGIPDSQRLLLSNKKVGDFGEWFDPWSFDPLPRIVNNSRYGVLASLFDSELLERLASMSALDGQDALTPVELTDKLFAAVWGSEKPDEHDRWTQADCTDLLIEGLTRRTTPDTTALYDSLLNRVEQRAKLYAQSGDRQVAAHGAWLTGRIERFRNRQVTEGL